MRLFAHRFWRIFRRASCLAASRLALRGVRVLFTELEGAESTEFSDHDHAVVPPGDAGDREIVFNFFEENPKKITCSADADCPSYYRAQLH